MADKQVELKKLADQLKVIAGQAKKLAEGVEAVDKHAAEIEKATK
jgi:prefoldin subunit 5